MFDYCILCVHIVPYTYDWPQQMQVFIGWVRLGSEECTYIPYNRAARFMPFSIDQKTSRIRNFYIKQIYGNSYYCVYLIGFQNRLLQTGTCSNKSQFDDVDATIDAIQSMEYGAWSNRSKSVPKQCNTKLRGYLHFKRKLLAAFDYDSCFEFIQQLKKINILRGTPTGRTLCFPHPSFQFVLLYIFHSISRLYRIVFTHPNCAL